MQPSHIVSQQEWIGARKALLEKEKAHMRDGDALAAERRALPWVKVEKAYVFDTPDGPKTLAELFEGRGQLIVRAFPRRAGIGSRGLCAPPAFAVRAFS